jgi:hypothetical protein
MVKWITNQICHSRPSDTFVARGDPPTREASAGEFEHTLSAVALAKVEGNPGVSGIQFNTWAPFPRDISYRSPGMTNEGSSPPAP